MKKDNRGVTLVELLISFAILGIVSAVIAGFITTSSNTYSTLTTEVNLQYESQMAMNQLQGYIPKLQCRRLRAGYDPLSRDEGCVWQLFGLQSRKIGDTKQTFALRGKKRHL